MVGSASRSANKALKSFVDGDVEALVATDVAARGVHVDDVAAVVHFDPPADSATYVRSFRPHRARRCSGVVIALVERGSEKSARQLQREVGIEVPVTKPSFVADIPPARTAVVHATPTSADRRTGTVKFFHDGRGYGFIDIGTDTDVFVHYTNTRSRLGHRPACRFRRAAGAEGSRGVRRRRPRRARRRGLIRGTHVSQSDHARSAGRNPVARWTCASYCWRA